MRNVISENYPNGLNDEELLEAIKELFQRGYNCWLP